MIENDAQFKMTCEQMQLMYDALLELRRRILPVNKRNYEIFAEGPIDEIRKLRQEIDAYLGLNEPATAVEPVERASA